MTAAVFLSYLLLAFACCCNAQQQLLPVKLPQIVINSSTLGSCPTNERVSAELGTRGQEIKDVLQNSVNPLLLDRYGTACGCGGIGWTKVTQLDMTDTNSACPTDWTQYSNPRSCGRSSSLIASTFFSVGGRSYSQVCGKVIAYQKGHTDAFFRSFLASPPGLEGDYIDGVSLTHGAAGSRQHIWSFVCAVYETGIYLRSICRCSDINVVWPHEVPSFIGDNYFCDAGNHGTTFPGEVIHQADPLWDGKGCGSTSTCCKFNSPPFFCTTLPNSTSEDLELRIMGSESPSLEDVRVVMVELHIK